MWSPVFGVSVQLPFPEGGPLKLALCDLISLARADWPRQTPDSCEPIRSSSPGLVFVTHRPVWWAGDLEGL